jgi:hypothetical protein
MGGVKPIHDNSTNPSSIIKGPASELGAVAVLAGGGDKADEIASYVGRSVGVVPSNKEGLSVVDPVIGKSRADGAI